MLSFFSVFQEDGDGVELECHQGDEDQGTPQRFMKYELAKKDQYYEEDVDRTHQVSNLEPWRVEDLDRPEHAIGRGEDRGDDHQRIRLISRGPIQTSIALFAAMVTISTASQLPCRESLVGTSSSFRSTCIPSPGGILGMNSPLSTANGQVQGCAGRALRPWATRSAPCPQSPGA